MRQLDLRTIAILTIALIAISASAPMIAFAAAPGLAIAFWRNTLATGLMAPIAGVRRRDEIRRLLRAPHERRTLIASVLAGLALAVHFGTWVPSAQLTSVATAVALVCTTPIWTALISVWRGIHVPRSTWLGIGVAVVGVALVTGVDLTASARALTGDALALAGGMAAAVYTSYGERARASISTTTYTAICYGICAVTLGAVCLIFGVPIIGFTDATWIAIVAMTVGPQMLGHSLFNYALQRVTATTIAILLLLEVPGAALIAWIWLDQLPEARTIPGLLVLMAGLAIVMLGNQQRARRRRANGGDAADRDGDQPTNGGTVIAPEAMGTT